MLYRMAGFGDNLDNSSGHASWKSNVAMVLLADLLDDNATPGSQFLMAWSDAMPAVFDPARYVAHSTLLARRLALRWPSLVRVLDHRTFYDPGWTEQAMRWLFDPVACMPDDELHEYVASGTGLHLFCSHANFVQWAQHMTEGDIDQPRCNLAKLMRPYL
jgi:hypothetical protein